MIRSIFLVLAICIQSLCAIEINIPNGWEEEDLPPPELLPDSIISTQQVRNEKRNLSVTISEVKIEKSFDAEIRKLINEVTNTGFTITSDERVKKFGYEGRRISAQVRYLPEQELVFSEGVVLNLGKSFVSVGVSGENPSDFVDEALSWLNLEEVRVYEESHQRDESSRNTWEYLGTFLVLGAVIYAIYNAVTARKKYASEV